MRHTVTVETAGSNPVRTATNFTSMRIFVKVKPKSHAVKTVCLDPTHYEVSVTCPPEDGKANEAVIEELAGYFDVAKSNVRLVSGATSRLKQFEIV